MSLTSEGERQHNAFSGEESPSEKRLSTAPAAEPGSSRSPGLVRRSIAIFKRHKRLVQVGVLLLVVVFLASGVLKSWSHLRSYSWQVQWGVFLAAYALFVAQQLSFALIWRAILRRLGAALPVLAAERIYLGAEFVRYIPGNVWHVITRVLWAEQRGVPKAVGFASMVVELATKIAAGALVFVATLFFWPDVHALTASVPRTALIALAAIGVPLMLLGLHPRLLAFALGRGMRLLKRDPVDLPLNYAGLMAVTAQWAANWCVAGVGFYLLVRAIVPGPFTLTGLLLAIGINAIAWDIGFLSFITPSGLGFREGAIAILLALSGLVGDPGLAIVIAFLARLLTTGAELASIAAAYLLAGQPAPPTPQIAVEDAPPASTHQS